MKKSAMMAMTPTIQGKTPNKTLIGGDSDDGDVMLLLC